MKKLIPILFAGLLFGCSQDKTQTDTKGPDTVVVVQQPTQVHTSSTNTTSTTSTSHTPEQKKDIIDKTNDAIDKTNKTVTRTSETVDKANELKRKTDELLHK